MGMKMPRGMPKPVEGATSKPADVTCYSGVGGAETKPKPIGTEQGIANSSAPPVKGTGTPTIY